MRFDANGLVDGGIKCRSKDGPTEVVYDLVGWLRSEFAEARGHYLTGDKSGALRSLCFGDTVGPFVMVYANASTFQTYYVHPEIQTVETSSNSETLATQIAEKLR